VYSVVKIIKHVVDEILWYRKIKTVNIPDAIRHILDKQAAASE
jgi:hypothetical protein